MRKVLFIFSDLSDADVDWLAAVGKRKEFPASSVLIEEGIPIDEVYILLEGELSVRVKARGGDPIAILQQGEIVGELSFLDSRPPSATVAARTDSVVLAISRDQLSTKLDRDPGFAAHSECFSLPASGIRWRVSDTAQATRSNLTNKVSMRSIRSCSNRFRLPQNDLKCC